MANLRVLIVSALLNAVWCGSFRKFPTGFKFGSSTSSYQIEGAWNASDKGESIWDRLVHTNPNAIKNAVNGDIAADSFNKWRQDVDIAADLGLNFYRFSISWSRLLPKGFTHKISEHGKKYYNNLIDALLEKGIEPVVTLYHWDMPQIFQDLGGWTNPLMSDWFAEYARYAFSIFGDRVKTWITINEAIVVCDFSYNTGLIAPGIKESTLAPFLCNKHILIGHAKAYRIYDEYFRPKQRGRVSLSNHLLWIEPLTPSDEALAELAREHAAGRYSHPIFSKKGGWPPSIEKAMAEYSSKQGFNFSKLPSFTKEEIKMMRDEITTYFYELKKRGAYDFYALNHYTTRLIRPPKPGENPGQWFITGSPEINGVLVVDPAWPYGASRLLPLYPEGIRRQIAWLKKQYGNVGFLITENGYSTSGSRLNDDDRVKFIKDYLEQVLLSIWVDGAKIMGYTYWSMIDNFEWMEGYSVKFGLYEVDFEDPERVRTPRASAQYYANIIRTNSIDSDAHQEANPLRRFRRKGPENDAPSYSGSLVAVSLCFVIAFLLVT